MLTREEYIQLSLEINLFFLRIMKEHAFFLEAAFVPKNMDLARTAEYYRCQLEQLLQEATLLSAGLIGKAGLATGQYVTPFTEESERLTQFYTGIPINMRITQMEDALGGAGTRPEPETELEDAVETLNRKATTAVTALIGFKTKLLHDLETCKLFMNTYWLLIDHILREARHYQGVLMALQSRMMAPRPEGASLVQDEAFWNNIMAEHSQFIRGLLDPTETALFSQADQFARQFDALTEQAKQAGMQPAALPKVTADSLAATEKVRDFNAAGTGGLNGCKIKAIILPLLGDHVLRESNHYLDILKRA